MITSQIEEFSENLIWEYVAMKWWETYLRAFAVRGERQKSEGGPGAYRLE